MEERRRNEREREGERKKGSGLKKRKENQISETHFWMKFTKMYTHTHLGSI